MASKKRLRSVCRELPDSVIGGIGVGDPILDSVGKTIPCGIDRRGIGKPPVIVVMAIRAPNGDYCRIFGSLSHGNDQADAIRSFTKNH